RPPELPRDRCLRRARARRRSHAAATRAERARRSAAAAPRSGCLPHALVLRRELPLARWTAPGLSAVVADRADGGELARARQRARRRDCDRCGMAPPAPHGALRARA